MTSSSEDRPKALVLWAWPRTRSTVFERFMLARPGRDVQVLHEPLSGPFFWSDDRVSSLFSQEQCDQKFSSYAKCTYVQTWQDMTTPPDGKTIVFTKDMAKYASDSIYRHPGGPELPDLATDGNPTFIPSEKLLSPIVKHVFLIRSPEKSVPSFVRLSTRDDVGIGHFNAEQIGIHQSRRLYDFLQQKLDKPPMIIESDDIVENTAAVLRKLCDLMGINFSEDMLNWPEDPDIDALFKKWEGWHDDAAASSGIDKAKAYNHDWPIDQQIQTGIEENMDDYHYLKGHAYKF